MSISLKRSEDELVAYAQAFPEVVPHAELAERMKGLLLEGGFPELAERVVVTDQGVVLRKSTAAEAGPGSVCWKAYRLAGGVRPCQACRELEVDCEH